MNARNHELNAPSKMFRARLVAPALESLSMATDEFADGTTQAMGLAAEIARAQCAYDERVAEAAYFLAQRRGFEPGREFEEWVAAEAQIANASRHLEADAKGAQVVKADLQI
jgi:hypothetical protein